MFEQRHFGLGCPNQSPLIKAGATETEMTEMLLLKQYVAGERVDFLDDYDFPARTINETFFRFCRQTYGDSNR